MKERPINLTAREVQDVFTGNKTQTRILLKPQPKFTGDGCVWYPNEPKRMQSKEKGLLYPNEKSFRKSVSLDFAPYGQPGDRLWVRETWGIWQRGDCTPRGTPIDPYFVYRADNENYKPDIPDYAVIEKFKWNSSIHMPREASRLFLEITNVRVERLQDISEEDAIAEGYGDPYKTHGSYKKWFKGFWESKHGAESWDINPWVWVYEFKKVGGI